MVSKGIRYVVHTIQLGIRDWFKKTESAEELLEKIRKIVTKFRTPNMLFKMTRQNFKKKKRFWTVQLGKLDLKGDVFFFLNAKFFILFSVGLLHIEW